MSSAEQFISKGYYAHSQIEGFISVKNYIFVRDQQQKYLLLRLHNLADFIANSLEFTITQLDSTGAVLATTTHFYDQLNFQPNRTFSLPKGIAVNEFCTDFKLNFTRVTSGNFVYRVQGADVAVFYTPVGGKDASEAEPVRTIWSSSIRPLKRGKQFLAVACGILALVLLFGLCTLRMYHRYQDALEEAQQDQSTHHSQSYDEFFPDRQ